MFQRLGADFNSLSPSRTLYEFESTLQTIEASGHQFLMEFDHFFIRVMFALQGQVVGVDLNVFEVIAANSYAIQNVKWPLAVTFEQQNKSLLFVDHNKIAQFVVIKKNAGGNKWDGRNCNPVTQWQKYQTNILYQIPHLRTSAISRLRYLGYVPAMYVLSQISRVRSMVEYVGAICGSVD